MEAFVFFFGLILTILVLLQTFKSVKIDSGWKKLDKLTTSFAQSKEELEFQVGRLNDLLKGLATDQGRYSSLKNHIRMLESETKELEEKQVKLNESCTMMKSVREELEQINAELAEKTNRQRDEILRNETQIRETEKRIRSLKEIHDGWEIAVNRVPAEEVRCLSRLISDMGIVPAVRQQLAACGIVRLGDLVGLDEQSILGIAGVGPVTLDIIKAKMSENGVSFDMDVVRIGNRWYRKQYEQVKE